ncbi:MAG: hypothetical protein KatS3mg019_1333 [Fimbriimonadales bacterium]|nr:MAG: hypothetical protein KatS3mg019_1333 [Fimbriimonadales bacterium]
MTTWLDRFTGVSYELNDAQRSAIRTLLAQAIAQLIMADNTHEAANEVANFWFENYYERVFPLRFGREAISNNSPYTQGKELKYENNRESEGLFPDGTVEWRERFLDAMRYPPLLPAETQPDPKSPALLIADHHLATAALLNVCLRRLGVSDDGVNQVRLGALVHELCDLPPIQDALAQYPQALALAQYLKSNGNTLPETLQPHQTLIDAIHTGNPNSAPDAAFCIVGLSAQRIKQYVFETPGLPEIRGASILLDAVVEQQVEQVAQQIGRECVLQSAASTLVFLAPEPADWVNRLKRAFYEKTLVAFCAAAAFETTLKEFLGDYSTCMRHFLSAMDADRYRAELPVWECLPFEARCAFCKKRAATTLEKRHDNDYVPLCEACRIKFQQGRGEKRRELGEQLLRDADIMQMLKEYNLHPAEAFTGGLNEMVPDSDEREQKKQIAFIYGDGSNFGQITKNLDSLALSLQWTRRAELVNRAAIALALSRAMHEALQDDRVKLQRMPFEVLVIGGDDFSLFTWSRLALRFCQQFVALTDLEYTKGDIQHCVVGDTPICYGIGCLISDEKAPAQRVVEFTEANLLKFAKRGVKAHRQGCIAFLYTTNADQIPGNYKDHLCRNYHKKARLGKGQATQASVYLTMQPLTAGELNAFLECATSLKDTLGSLQRLAEPFVRQPIEAALLHFVYQQARAENSDDRREFFESIMRLQASDGKDTRVNLFPIQRLRRITVDKDQSNPAYFAPILDLLEIVKSMR